MPNLDHILEASVDADALAADASTVIGSVGYHGITDAVEFIPNADKSGANTDTRTLTLYNDGSADADSPVAVAVLALVSGTDLDQGVAKPFVLSATAANLVLATGDVLRLESDHGGSTGLTQPGGKLRIHVRAASDTAEQGMDRS